MAVAQAWLGTSGEYCPTPQDSEGIFQYLLAMPVPLSQYQEPERLLQNFEPDRSLSQLIMIRK